MDGRDSRGRLIVNSLSDLSETNEIELLGSGGVQGFMVLPGEEIGTSKSEADTKYYLVAINIREEIGPEEEPQLIIEETLKQGGEIIVAHPYWSSLTVNDLMRLHGYLGLERFNPICLLSIRKGYSTIRWDDLLEDRG